MSENVAVWSKKDNEVLLEKIEKLEGETKDLKNIVMFLDDCLKKLELIQNELEELESHAYYRKWE